MAPDDLRPLLTDQVHLESERKVYHSPCSSARPTSTSFRSVQVALGSVRLFAHSLSGAFTSSLSLFLEKKSVIADAQQSQSVLEQINRAQTGLGGWSQPARCHSLGHFICSVIACQPQPSITTAKMI